MGKSKFNSNIKTKSGSKFMLKIEGINNILNNLELTKKQGANLKAFLSREAEKIKNTAMQLVPKDTLRLMDSHRVEESRSAKGGKDVIAVDILVGGISVRGREVDYATAVHEGYTDARSGVKHAARPWLATAVRLHASGFESRLKKAVKIYGSK